MTKGSQTRHASGFGKFAVWEHRNLQLRMQLLAVVSSLFLLPVGVLTTQESGRTSIGKEAATPRPTPGLALAPSAESPSSADSALGRRLFFDPILSGP
jgi:cytochrome c peroxidase